MAQLVTHPRLCLKSFFSSSSLMSLRSNRRHPSVKVRSRLTWGSKECLSFSIPRTFQRFSNSSRQRFPRWSKTELQDKHESSATIGASSVRGLLTSTMTCSRCASDSRPTCTTIRGMGRGGLPSTHKVPQTWTRIINLSHVPSQYQVSDHHTSTGRGRHGMTDNQQASHLWGRGVLGFGGAVTKAHTSKPITSHPPRCLPDVAVSLGNQSP